MIRLNAESGHRIYKPETKIDWRGMATGMILAADELGIPRSQLPKYELPDWALVATFMPGSDRVPLTPTQFSEKLLEHNIRKSRHQISRIIYHMINRQEAIHPHRRAIGRGCFDFVKAAGGVKTVELPREQTGTNWVVYAYQFGLPNDEVVELRKATGLSVRG